MATLRKVVSSLHQNKIIITAIRVNQAVCGYATDKTTTSSSGETASPSGDSSSNPNPQTPPAAAPAAVDDNKSYQTMEYYAHNEWSYYDIDKDMATDRLIQPSKFDEMIPKEEPPKK